MKSMQTYGTELYLKTFYARQQLFIILSSLADITHITL